MQFLRGDKVSMHISNVLQRLASNKTSSLGEIARKQNARYPATAPKHSINYALDPEGQTVIEIPLDNPASRNGAQVLLHTRNAENDRVSLMFTYSRDGQLLTQSTVNHEKAETRRVLQNFEKGLKPFPSRRDPLKISSTSPLNKTVVLSKPHAAVSTRNKTLEEIGTVQNWWEELQKSAGYKDRVPMAMAADFLVSKGVAKSRDRARQLLGAGKGRTHIDFDVFRELMYRGVLRNAIKYIYGEIQKKKPQNDSSALPEFMQIANYKKDLLMKAFDPTDPQYKQGLQIFDALKKHRLKLAPESTSAAKEKSVETAPRRTRHICALLRPRRTEGETEDPMQIIERYKKLVSTKPEVNEYMVYHG